MSLHRTREIGLSYDRFVNLSMEDADLRNKSMAPIYHIYVEDFEP